MSIQNSRPKSSKGFSKISYVLPETAKRYKLEPALLKFKVVKYWEEALTSFFENAKDQTKILDLSNGRLTIACLSKDLAYEIKLLAQRIIYSLNCLIGKTVIYALQVEC